MSSYRILFRSAMIVGVGVLLGRLAGFVREATLAAKFGISVNADSAVLMLTVPDLLLNLLVGGAMAAALIPMFKLYNKQQSCQLVLQFSLITLILFSILALLLNQFPGYLIKIAAPGMSQAAMSHTAYYLRWVVWMLPLTALAGVTTAYLQSQERFLLPALGTLLFNSCLIVGLIITSSQNLLASLALCILIGASLRWLSQLLSLRQPSSYFISWDAWLIDHKLLVRYFQAVLAGGVLVYLPVIANAYASLTGAGGLATMNYANKLVQLPMGVALGAAAIVLLPKFSELLQSEQPTQVQQGISLLQQSSMFMLILSFALCLSLCLFASPVTSLIFHRGQINNQNIVDISKLAMIGFLSLPAQALISLLVAAFNAQRNTATPFWVSCIGLLVFFPVATILHHKFALQGVVISIVAVYWLIMILQVVYLWRKQHITIFNRHSVPVILRCFVTQCLIMSFIAWINFNTPPNVWYNIALFCITMLLLSAAGLLQVAPFRQNLLSKIRMEIP